MVNTEYHSKGTKANLSSNCIHSTLADPCEGGSVHYFMQFSNSRYCNILLIKLDTVMSLLLQAEPIYGTISEAVSLSVCQHQHSPLFRPIIIFAICKSMMHTACTPALRIDHKSSFVEIWSVLCSRKPDELLSYYRTYSN